MKQLLAKQSSDNLVTNPVTKEISQAKVTPTNIVDNKLLTNSIVSKTGDGLNSNVIKLSDHVKKLNKSFNDSIKATARMSTQQVGDVTANAMGKRQFNTLRPRVEGFKENVKDFFTMRGFLDKTGIAKRSSGGLVSEYLDRGEAKKKYVDQRMKTKGTTFGSKETFEKQFDEQQRIQSEIGKNEKQIKELQASGATDVGLKRGGYLKKREDLAANYAKVTPDARPEGFDPKTGTMKLSKDDTTGSVIPFKKSSAEAVGGEEAMLEQNKMVSEQTSLLIQIEENTRGLGGGGDKPTSPTPNSSGSGMGLMDMLGMGGIGKKVLGGVKAAGSFLGKGALGAAKFIGKNPLLMAGTAVAAGAYTGYKGYQAAGDKQDAANAQTDADLAAGKITKEQAASQKLQTGETATVGKSKSVGKGSGMAVGGAAGALKGAAIGATLGSVVPVVGTAIGGLLGGAIGGIGGSYLGGKAGDYLGEKTGQVINYAPKAYKSVKESASNFYDGAKRMAGDAGEGLLRAKNKVSDVAYMATETTKSLVDRNTGGALTKVGNAFSGAKNSVLGMLGMGDKVVDNGDGSKTTFKSDGTKIVQDGGGTKTYDKNGKLISEKSPTFAGASTETRADGSKVENYNSGPLSLKKETTAAGGQQTTGEYDLGVARVAYRETLTPKQMKERGIDAKMAAGLPDKIPGGGQITDPNAPDYNAGYAEYMRDKGDITGAAGGTAPVLAAPARTSYTMIANERVVPGQPLSDKQMAVISMSKSMGNSYSPEIEKQYAMQKLATAPTTKGVQSGLDGDSLSKKSTQNEQAKLDAAKPSSGGNTNVVNAPVNNTTNQTQLIKSPVRNQESSQSKYLDSRYAF